MDLSPYCFSVTERKVAVDDQEHPTINLEDTDTYLNGPYKAIVREDTNELISIVRNSYHVVPNEQLIQAVLNNLLKSGHSFKLDHLIPSWRMQVFNSSLSFRINGHCRQRPAGWV